MKKREDIVQKFSTFISFGGHNSGGTPIWQAEPELERYMKRLAQLDPEAKEEFWARHFLKILRGVSQVESSRGVEESPSYLVQEQVTRRALGKEESSLKTKGTKTLQTTELQAQDADRSSLRSQRHLSAYLQEACMWAAQRLYKRFKFLRHKYPVQEYFQIANSVANSPAKLLSNFKFDYHKTNIEGYAKTAIIRFVSNTIYSQDLESKREKFSDYGLLKDLNNKELKEALVSKGIKNHQIQLYCLCWQCFDEICQPNQSFCRRHINPPNPKDLKQIAEKYNQQINQLYFSSTPVGGEKIQEMLSTCIRAAREYRTKRFIPLENYDSMSDPMPTPWDIIMQEEEWDQIQEIVSRLFQSMPDAGQTMLKLWHGLNLTQTEIAKLLSHKYPELQKQYQVARHMGKYTRNLLKEFANEWNKVNPVSYLKDEKDIERIKDSLDECLQSYCIQLLCSILNKIVEQADDEKKLLLCDNKIKANQQQSIPFAEVSKRRLEAKKKLINNFTNEIEMRMNLARDSLYEVNDKIGDFVNEWLKKVDRME